MSAEHSKLPFRMYADKHQIFVRSAEYVSDSVYVSPPGKQHEANAQYIVRACNAHEALVRALESLANAIEINPVTLNELAGSEELSNAREVLRLAQGERP